MESVLRVIGWYILKLEGQGKTYPVGRRPQLQRNLRLTRATLVEGLVGIMTLVITDAKQDNSCTRNTRTYMENREP